MATPGKPLDQGTVARIERLIEQRYSVRKVARAAGVCTRTITKYGKKTRRP